MEGYGVPERGSWRSGLAGAGSRRSCSLVCRITGGTRAHKPPGRTPWRRQRSNPALAPSPQGKQNPITFKPIGVAPRDNHLPASAPQPSRPTAPRARMSPRQMAIMGMRVELPSGILPSGEPPNCRTWSGGHPAAKAPRETHHRAHFVVNPRRAPSPPRLSGWAELAAGRRRKRRRRERGSAVVATFAASPAAAAAAAAPRHLAARAAPCGCPFPGRELVGRAPPAQSKHGSPGHRQPR